MVHSTAQWLPTVPQEVTNKTELQAHEMFPTTISSQEAGPLTSRRRCNFYTPNTSKMVGQWRHNQFTESSRDALQQAIYHNIPENYPQTKQ